MAGLISYRTGNGAVTANSRMTRGVSSAEVSSQTIISSGGRVWAAMLASCAGRYRPPLYVQRAAESVGMIGGQCLKSMGPPRFVW
ncbi:MAG: hypothetical protein JWO38_6929 [Gemmataceae bacterium]|nr:hypothetical protein [Gemmataceae bacterium]